VLFVKIRVKMLILLDIGQRYRLLLLLSGEFLCIAHFFREWVFSPL